MKLIITITILLYLVSLAIFIWQDIRIIQQTAKGFLGTIGSILNALIASMSVLIILMVLGTLLVTIMYHWLVIKQVPSSLVWVFFGMIGGIVLTYVGLTVYEARYDGLTITQQLSKQWSGIKRSFNFNEEVPEDYQLIADDFAPNNPLLAQVAYKIMAGLSPETRDLKNITINAYSEEGRSLLGLALQAGNARAARNLFLNGADPMQPISVDGKKNYFNSLADPYFRIGLPLEWKSVTLADINNPAYQTAVETQVVAFTKAYIDAGGDPNVMILGAQTGELINDEWIEYQEREPLIMRVSYGMSLPLRYLVSVGADPWKAADTLPDGLPVRNLMTQLANWSRYNDIEWLLSEGYFDNRSSIEYTAFLALLKGGQTSDETKNSVLSEKILLLLNSSNTIPN